MAFRWRWFVVVLWVAVLGAVGFAASRAPAAADEGFTMPGIESQKAFDLMERRFPGTTADAASARIVFIAPSGEKVTAAGNRAAIEKLVDEAADGSQVAAAVDPFQAKAVSKDGTTAYATVSFKATADDLTDASKKHLESAIAVARQAGLRVEVGGDALATQPAAGGPAEVIGIAVAAVVLLITFGSLAAAGLPLLAAIIGVAVGMTGIMAPLPVLLLGVVGLGAVATPVMDLQLGMPGDEAKPTSTTERRAYDALAEGFGPGFNGPLTIVVDANDSDDPKADVATITKDITATRGVVSVSAARFNQAGDTAVFSATPATSPTDQKTKDLVKAIRDERPGIEKDAGVSFEVTGKTALDIDVAEKVQASLVPYLAVVVSLAVVLLLLVFRSLLVPLKAAFGFLLSVSRPSARLSRSSSRVMARTSWVWSPPARS